MEKIDLKNLPLICDITNDDYHSAMGLSKSGVMKLLDCPLRYWDKYINSDKPESETTPAMDKGNIAHTLILEPEKFESRYLIVPDQRRGTNKWKEHIEEAQDKELVMQSDYDDCQRARDSILKHPYASKMFHKGEAEKSIFWINEETKQICKTRPDYIQGKYLVDLKTCSEASPLAAKSAMANLGYHIQAAMALDGVSAISSHKYEMFFNVFVEVKRPYIVTVFKIEDDVLDFARSEYRRALKIYKDCLEKNEWSAYSDEILPLSLPVWALPKSFILNEGV